MGFQFNSESAELTPMPGMPVQTQERARQFVIHPSGKFLYSVNVYSDTVSAFRIDDASGALSKIKGSPYSVGNAPVDIMVPMEEIPEGITQGPYNITAHPSGDFVFVANWMSASVSVFKVDADTGQLALVEGSPFKSDPHPYDLIVSPNGHFLYSAHWAMNTLVGFSIDIETGTLKRIESAGVTTLGQAPVDLYFHESDNILYVTHYFSHNIATYHYDPKTGALSLENSSPTRFGPRAFSVAYGDDTVRFSSKFLYTISQRKKSLSAYTLNGETGEPEKAASIELKAKPIALAYDSVNQLIYVATNNPDQLQVFSLKNGVEFEPAIETPLDITEKPGSVVVGVNGIVIYVLSPQHDRLIIFERHPKTGEVKEWPESPRTTDPKPVQLKIDPAGRHLFLLSAKNNMLSSYRGREGLWPLLDKIDMNRKFGKENGKFSAMTTDPLGNFMYAADSVNNEIAVYWINTSTGNFEDARKSNFKVGENPVDIIVHPSGKWMYIVNSDDATVETFRVDNIFGGLKDKLQTAKTSPSPRSIKLDAAGRFAYLAYKDSRKVSIYTIDGNTGLLSHKKDIDVEGAITDYVLDRIIE
jgi:6-phosphogluconolactonase (cycloisomerase 2 family)